MKGTEMAHEIIMPQIGQDMTTGVIVKWLKKENDTVERDEVICEVEGDKGVFDVEAENAGTLLKILFAEGAEVEVFKPIGYIGDPGETFT